MAFYNVAFSKTGDYFAYTSPDGCLKIWETASNSLKQEYTPSSHLSATCTSMAWGPCKQDAESPSKRVKRSKSNKMRETISDLNLIAMGTLSGEVLLYSVNKGDLHTKMTGGHSSVVTGISWHASDDAMFTCSKDQHIVRWSISKGSVVNKWKADKTSIHSICVVDDNNLLSASSSICWWDIKTQNLLKKFTGHATEVFCLLPINVLENSQELKYVISSAVGDRVANIWQLDNNSDGNAIASFALTEEPAVLDLSENINKQQPFVFSAVTRSGVLLIFEHQLNGKLKKPLTPIHTLHLASKAKASEKSQPISILSAKLLENPDVYVLAYGSLLNPIFEKMKVCLSEKETYLIKEIKSFSDVTLEGVSKVKIPERPNDTKVLAPGYMAPIKPTENVSRKKKRKETSNKELPMEERLNAMYLGQVPQSEEVPDTPTPNSMVHLLLQGLQSKDNNLLDTALKSSNEVLIKNTVKRLPLNSIPLLLKELHRRLTKKEHGNRPCLRWLKGVFSIHLSYLMSLQEIDEYIGPVSQLIEAREETFSKMCQLKGFLDILWSQVDAKTDNTTELPSEALTVYEESSSSSSEEDDMEEMEPDTNDVEKLPFDSSSSSESDNDIALKSSDDEMEW